MAETITVRMLEDGHGICQGIDRDTGHQVPCVLGGTADIAEDTAETLLTTGLVERVGKDRDKDRVKIRVIDDGYGIGKKDQVRDVPASVAERWYRRGIAVHESESLLPLVLVEMLQDDQRLGSCGRRFQLPSASAKYLANRLLVKLIKTEPALL